MKAEKFTMQSERTRSRAHRVLFDDGLPFRGRVEKPKNNYVRRDKHRGRMFNLNSDQ
jgi:stalled ribosome alternative rescue factor ArfA